MAAKAGRDTHPSTPASEPLHGICHEFHPLAERSLNVHLLVRLCHCGEEKHEQSEGFELVASKENEIGDQSGELVGLRWGDVRLIWVPETHSHERR